MASKTKKFINKTLKPMMGGALLEDLSGESASGEHYTKKLNFRRHQEGEARREGWDVFKPSGKFLEAFPQIFTGFPSDFPIRLICQFRSGDNRSCLVVAAGDKIYRYKFDANPEYINKNAPSTWVAGDYFEEGYIDEPPADFKWEVIASGLQHVEVTVGDYFPNEVSAWEAVVVNGALYLNNGKDLPLVFREEWDAAVPLHELRENPAYRVAAVGTISEYNGFLMLADVHQIHVDDWVDWMRGSDPYGMILDSPEYIQGVTRTTRSQYSIIWSYEGDGNRYGTSVIGTMQSGTNQFISKYPIATSVNGDTQHPMLTFSPGTEVVIIGAGTPLTQEVINGEDVGGVLGYSSTELNYSRIKIGSVTDNGDGTMTFTVVDKDSNPVNAIASITDSELATPLVASVTGYMIRLDSIGKLTSVVDLVDDGSRILKMKTLVDRLMIYRDTGYMTAIRVNTAEVFQFERRYTGPRVVDFRNTLIDVAGRYHVFMGYTGIYQTDRAASQPKLLQSMETGMYHLEAMAVDRNGLRTIEEINVAVGNASPNSIGDWEREIHEVILNEGETFSNGDIRNFPKLECYLTLADDGSLALINGTPGNNEGRIWGTNGKANRPKPHPVPFHFYITLNEGRLQVLREKVGRPKVLIYQTQPVSEAGPFKLGVTASKRLAVFRQDGLKTKIVWRSPG